MNRPARNAQIIRAHILLPQDMLEDESLILEEISRRNELFYKESGCFFETTLWPLKEDALKGRPLAGINQLVKGEKSILMAYFASSIGSSDAQFGANVVDAIRRFHITKRPMRIFFNLKPLPNIVELDLGQMEKLKRLKFFATEYGFYREVANSDDLIFTMAAFLRSVTRRYQIPNFAEASGEREQRIIGQHLRLKIEIPGLVTELNGRNLLHSGILRESQLKPLENNLVIRKMEKGEEQAELPLSASVEDNDDSVDIGKMLVAHPGESPEQAKTRLQGINNIKLGVARLQFMSFDSLGNRLPFSVEWEEGAEHAIKEITIDRTLSIDDSAMHILFSNPDFSDDGFAGELFVPIISRMRYQNGRLHFKSIELDGISFLDFVYRNPNDTPLPEQVKYPPKTVPKPQSKPSLTSANKDKTSVIKTERAKQAPAVPVRKRPESKPNEHERTTLTREDIQKMVQIATKVSQKTPIVKSDATKATEKSVPVEPCRLEYIQFVPCPSGDFIMGDVWGDGNENELPVRRLHVDSFRISTTHIRNDDFALFVNEYGQRQIKIGNYKGKEIFIPHKMGLMLEGKKWTASSEFCSHPMITVTWYGAMAYCQWLGGKLKTRVSLPGETQWEYAARNLGQSVVVVGGIPFRPLDAQVEIDGLVIIMIIP